MYIARQAIFNRKLDVYGYELLYRANTESISYDGVSSIQATVTVLDGLFEAGVNNIAGGKKAFVNFDGEFIFSEGLELISNKKLIIEVLEDVKVTDDLIDRLRELKDRGYKIALDDFVFTENIAPLIPIADIIKFDLSVTSLNTIEHLVEKALNDKKIILAEKVETQKEFLDAKEMGFHLFQGYFFHKPHIVGKSINNRTVKGQYVRLLKELKKEEPSYYRLSEIIEKDATLSYKLLGLISGRAKDEFIYSIRRSLAYIGFRDLERWINILMLREFSQSKPNELMRISLLRSRFMEILAGKGQFKELKREASTIGLFSTLDAMINLPMEEALKDIYFPKVITNVLVHNMGVLYPLYQLVIAYEKSEWSVAEKLGEVLKISDTTIFEAYLSSIEWSKEIMESILMYSR